MVLDSAVGSIHHVLSDEDPIALVQLLDLSVAMLELEMYEIALVIIKAIADIGASTLGQQHPLPRVACFLLRLDCSDIAEVCTKCFQAFGDQFEDVLGPLHISSLDIRLREDRVTDGQLRDLLHRCQSDLGVSDSRTTGVYLSWLWKLYENSDYGLAIEECHEFLSHNHRKSARLRTETLEILALCEEEYSKRGFAMMHLREAIDIRISLHGSLDGRARRWLLQLKEWLTDDDEEEEAADVQRWWEFMRYGEVASQAQATP